MESVRGQRAGVSPLRDWGEFDATVATPDLYGVQLEPIVVLHPRLGQRRRGALRCNPDLNHFERFMTGAMKRYPDPRLGDLERAQHGGVRPAAGGPGKVRVDPPRRQPRPRGGGLRATLVSGGLAPDSDGEFTKFGEQIARLGAFRYVDALGVHPYSQQRPDQDGSSFLNLPEAHSRIPRRRALDPVLGDGVRLPQLPAPDQLRPARRRARPGRPPRARLRPRGGWPWVKRLTWTASATTAPAATPTAALASCARTSSRKRAWDAYLDVLAGRLPRFDTRVSIRRRLAGGEAWGSPPPRAEDLRRLLMPGTDPARGEVVVTATRRLRKYRRRRRIRVQLEDGRYSVSLGRSTAAAGASAPPMRAVGAMSRSRRASSRPRTEAAPLARYGLR